MRSIGVETFSTQGMLGWSFSRDWVPFMTPRDTKAAASTP